MVPFGHVLTAVVTPFAADGGVDHETFSRLVRWLLANGSDGVVVAGTTGESPTLSDDEKLALFATAVDAAGGRGRVVAGTGTYDTAHSIRLTSAAGDLGVDGVMAVTPYYSRPSQGGLIAHFTAIAEASSVPVMLYNIPGRTGRLIEVPTLVRLADHPRIVATKDAVDDVGFTSRSRVALPDDFTIYSGSDIFTLPQMAVGASGVVSVASHVVGPQIARMIEAFRKGEIAEARRLHLALVPVFDACFAEPSPQPVRAGLSAVWDDVGDPRLPMIPASEQVTAALVAAIATVAAL